MPTIESRDTVGLARPRSRPRFPGPKRGTTAHWNGPAMRLRGRPHSECRARWRGVQGFHMKPKSQGGNGWEDVAYTAAVCHHGIVMEGRGPGVRTAANGTTAGNNSWYAIFFMVGGSEEPSDEMLAAAEWYARVHLGTSTWNRHRDHKATTCAGTVNAYVSGGRLRVVAESRSYITRGDQGDDVKAWQRDLMDWNSSALPDYGADGDFGDETVEWTIKFMKAVALIGSSANPENPMVGAKTLAAMEDRLSPPVAPPDPDPVPEPGPFPDVEGDSVHADVIARAKELGLFAGYADGTFRPYEPLTRAGAAAALVRLYDALVLRE